MAEKPVRVLVVEDNQEDFEILLVHFSKIRHRRYELENAASLSKALTLLRKREHDAYLVDYQLGPDSGMDFLKEAAGLKVDAPIIFLTGYGDHEMDLKAMSLGAADFLNKNKLDPGVLERSVRYALERRKAQENLARLATVVETTHDAVFVLGLDGTILTWNPGAARIFGYPPDEIGGRNVSQLLSPSRRKDFQEALGRVGENQGFKAFVAPYRTKSGQEILLSLSLSPITDPSGRINRVSVIARDVTESEKARMVQEMLQAERDQLLERLQLQMESMPIALILFDHDFQILYWNPAAERIFGHDLGDVIGRTPAGLLLKEEEWPRAKEFLERLAREGVPDRGDVLENLGRGGRKISCEWYATSLRDHEGNFTGTMCMVLDVTERLKSEGVRSQLAAILQQTPDAVVGCDLDHRVFSWNKGAEVMFGWTLEEILGKPVDVLEPPDMAGEMARLRDTVLAGGIISNFEALRRRKDGSVVEVSVTLSALRDLKEKVVGTSAIIRDITEYKRAQDSLRRHEEQMHLAEKMNAIGRLAGGVAHDFNNLLSVIGGNAEFLLADLPKDDPRREEMEEIQKAVKRGSDLTKQLLVFGQKQVVKPQPIDLNEVLSGMERMLKRLISADIELTILRSEGIRYILADKGQLEQVILNLVLNSQDAMPQGGHLILETKALEVKPQEEVGEASLPAGTYVGLNVTDTGMGMDEETRKRVFEPFFTTKTGKGTGLGLATVFSIVTKWSGHIEVRSKPNSGTTFALSFPALQAVVDPVEKPKQMSLIGQGTETILLAEDEKAVRQVLVRNLERHGYKVIEAANGIEAVQKSWSWKDPIHLLVTDTVMPKMNGRELADELRKTRKKIKVLFISGYPREILSQQGILDPGIRLLQKPFEFEELLREIRKALDEK